MGRIIKIGMATISPRQGKRTGLIVSSASSPWIHSLPDDNALSACSASYCLLLGLRRAFRAIRVATARSATVQLDAVAGAGDAVAFTGAARAGRRDGRRRRGVAAAARAERWHVRVVVALLAGRVIRGVIELVRGEAARQLLDVLVLELLGADLRGLEWAGWLRRLDLGWRKRSTLGYCRGRDAALVPGGLGGRASDHLTTFCGWDVEGVELAASSGLGHGLAGGIMGNMVAVDDVVVPVSLTLLQSGALESECTFPATGFSGILGQGKLTGVVVPRAEQVHGLAVGGSAESEVELDSGHCSVIGMDLSAWR